MIEQITHNKQLLSIIVRDSYCKEGISFFTPDEFSQQLEHPVEERTAQINRAQQHLVMLNRNLDQKV